MNFPAFFGEELQETKNKASKSRQLVVKKRMKRGLDGYLDFDSAKIPNIKR